MVVATDITEKKRAEDALKQSEERLRMIIANIKDYSVITLDRLGHVTSWNGAAERIKGYRADEVIGKRVSIFYTSDDVSIGKPTTELDTAIKSGRFEDDGWRIRKDGSQFWANVVVTPLLDQVGSVRGFVKVTRDTTEKRIAEQQLLQRSGDSKRPTTNWNPFPIPSRTTSALSCVTSMASAWAPTASCASPASLTG